jgi:hypothetical protein
MRAREFALLIVRREHRSSKRVSLRVKSDSLSAHTGSFFIERHLSTASPEGRT